MTYREHPERAEALGSVRALAAFLRMTEDVKAESQFDVSYLTHLATLAGAVEREARTAADRWREDHGWVRDEDGHWQEAG